MPDRPTPLAIADEIVRRVGETTPGGTGVATRDRNDRLLVASYGRAYRCFISIRELASRGEADDAAVLTRTLLSIGLRSLYLVATEDAAERDLRFRRAARTYFDDLRKVAKEEVALGAVDPSYLTRLDEDIAELASTGVPPLPSDYDIAKSLDLLPFYTRVYRPGSDVTHYSIGSALDGFLELTHHDLIGSVSLEMPQPDKADDVLLRASLTYGIFLERVEPVIGHGLAAGITTLIAEYFEHTDDETADQ